MGGCAKLRKKRGEILVDSYLYSMHVETEMSYGLTLQQLGLVMFCKTSLTQEVTRSIKALMSPAVYLCF